MVILEMTGLTKYFGGLHAVDNFSASINQGEITALIGPNGAGKSTIFNMVTGVISPTSGKIIFSGENIIGKRSHEIAKFGVGRTFQQTVFLGEYTAMENVVASSYLHLSKSFWEVIFNIPNYRRNVAIVLEQSSKILNLVGLSKVENELSKNLPHGYQKMLAIARALAIQPILLLLDEPLGGLNVDEITFTMDILAKLRQQGLTIFIIEHNMRIFSLCDRVLVINFGEKIADGSVEEVRNNPEVIRAYLGEQYVA